MVTREVGGFLISLSRAPEEHHVQAGQRAGSNWHIRQTTQLASNTNRKITQENWGRQTGRQTSAHKRRETHQPNNAISLLEIMLNTLLVCYVNKYSEKPTGVYINNKRRVNEVCYSREIYYKKNIKYDSTISGEKSYSPILSSSYPKQKRPNLCTL